MSDGYVYREFQVTLDGQSDLCAFVVIEGHGPQAHRIPWSQIEDNGEDFRNGYKGPMQFTSWICEKAGLVD